MKFLFCSSRGGARKAGFYAFFSKIFSFCLRIEAIFLLSDICGSKTEPFFVCGIKIDAAFWTEISALASKLMPLRAPSLIPSWRSRFLSSFQKIFPSLNPHLEYPLKISPTIPYSNFCNWKTTRFLKKFSLNPIPQLSKPKNDIFSETFSKNVLTPLPHVFGQKTDTLFQKSFPKSVPQVFLSKSQHRKETIFYSYTAAFIPKI